MANKITKRALRWMVIRSVEHPHVRDYIGMCNAWALAHNQQWPLDPWCVATDGDYCWVARGEADDHGHLVPVTEQGSWTEAAR